MNKNICPIPEYTNYQIRNIRRKIIESGKENYQVFPWRSPQHLWHGLLAEVLLQRTRAKNVVPVYSDFIDRFHSPEQLAVSDLREIESLLYPLGLKWRAKWIKKLGQALTQGDLPFNLEKLLDLPAVGPYAANAFLAFHSDVRALLIDSNTTRFLCRLSGNEYHGETRRETWVTELLAQITPLRNSRTFNIALLDFTMLVCVPRKPRCESCQLKQPSCKFGKLKSTN
jgi:A/G-specific adenine glycosylase